MTERWIKEFEAYRESQPQPPSLYGKRRDLVVSLASQGLNSAQIVERLNCSRAYAYSVCRGAAIKLPRAPKGRRCITAPSERDQKIIGLRNMGTELEIIGRQFGMTRERVRQICKRWGSISARQAMAIQMEKRRADFTCPHCGKTVHKLRTQWRGYCSLRCRLRETVPSLKQNMQIAPVIYALMVQGYSWQRAAEAAGITHFGRWNGFRARKIVMQWAKEHPDVDLSRICIGKHSEASRAKMRASHAARRAARSRREAA